MNRCAVIFFLFLSVCISAQDSIGSIEVHVSTDSVYLGNHLRVKFLMKNIAGDFQPPEFSGLNAISGPNVMSSFSSMNGKVSRYSSYEFILMPQEAGNYSIGSAELVTDEEVLYTDEVTIVVLDNPDGIIQENVGFEILKEPFFSREGKAMSKSDSLKMKLRHLKTKKI